VLKALLWPVLAACALAGCQPAEVGAPLLNSERIEREFGSYGIEVVYSDSGLRLSNLYSTHDGHRITRTFAIVGYPGSVPPDYAAEHRAILDGASIGATFRSAGWNVVKDNLLIDEVPAFAPLTEGMQTSAGALLALHAYELDVARNGERYAYAVIVEIHHPDYLDRADLLRIYGGAPQDETPGGERARDLIARGRAVLAAPGSALGE
jgi:hypothetical protein